MRPIRSSGMPEKQEPFGLVGWLEQTKVALPLKGVECRFDVCGDVINVEIDQIYHQNAPKPLDCLYSFPLPFGAAVYRCELHVNDRVIRAKVEELYEARAMFLQRKAEGRRAALVEVERENLFSLSLGNLQPDDVVVVRFGYCQTIERLGREMSLRIPVCPGVRYIPGKALLRDLSGRGIADDTDHVPDASRISPPRLDRLDPSAAYFSIEGKIDSAVALVESIASPTHPVVVRIAEQAFGITMGQQGAVPDRDFVLRWQETAASKVTPLAWGLHEAGNTYALVQLRAPEFEEPADRPEQDVYFLIDRSGSMSGLKWTKTCEALREFVNNLGERERVWITFFESTHQDYSEAPMRARDLFRNSSFRGIEGIGTTGGTELLPAMRHVMEKIDLHSAGRQAMLLIITDGQIGNENEVLAELRRHRRDLKTHVFGIDTAVNDAFLKEIAQQQGGQCFLLTPNDNITGTVVKLAGHMRRPVLTDIEASAGWKIAGGHFPDLYSGTIADLSLRTRNGEGLKITGRLPDGSKQSFEFELTAVANPALRLIWTRNRITALLAENKEVDAIALAKSANIICRGTAFVAWDEAEKVAIAADSIYQPAVEQLDFRMRASMSRSGGSFFRSSVGERMFGCRVSEKSMRLVDSLETAGENRARGQAAKTLNSDKLLPIKVRYISWRNRSDSVSQLENWQQAFRRHLSTVSEADVMLDIFCFWAVQAGHVREERAAKLEELRAEFESLPDKSWDRVIAIFRRFADSHFKAGSEIHVDFDRLVTLITPQAETR